MKRFGHVPIPLLHPKNEFDGTKHIIKNSKYRTYQKKMKLNKQYLIGNTGKLWDIRLGFHTLMDEYVMTHSDNTVYKYYRCHEMHDRNCKINWNIFQTECCKFMITIRGRGASTFSLMENLQLSSAIPVYVYDNPFWLPYKIFHDKFAVHVKWKANGLCKDTIKEIVSKLKSIYYDNNGIQYESMLNWIKNNRNEYFTRKGVIKQIQYFLIEGHNENDLNKNSKLHCFGGKPHLRNRNKDSICPDIDGDTMG